MASEQTREETAPPQGRKFPPFTFTIEGHLAIEAGYVVGRVFRYIPKSKAGKPLDEACPLRCCFCRSFKEGLTYTP